MATPSTRYFVNAGSDVHIVKMNPSVSHTELKPKIYSVNYSDLQGFFLTEVKDRFDMPEKIYGNSVTRADKVIRSYSHRDTSMGVLMTGNKGSGKTLLTQVIANKMIDGGVPVVLVNAPYKGDGFNRFINDIGECVVMFDEFGKMFDKDDQEYLLTFMDGSMSSKRLVLLTENDRFYINNFMLNRPGRILYHFEYDRVPQDVITEMCFDSEIPADVTEEIVRCLSTVPELNVDIVKAVLSEWHIHKEPIADIISDMNVINTSSRSFMTAYRLTMSDGRTFDMDDLIGLGNDVKCNEYQGSVGFRLERSDRKKSRHFNEPVPEEPDFVIAAVNNEPTHRKYTSFEFDEDFVSSDGVVNVFRNHAGDVVYLKQEMNNDRFNPNAL